MKNRYNIALIPIKESESVIKCAHFLSNVADSYLLGKSSLPHVTLYQFQANESDIRSIWERACSELSQTSIELTFKKFSCITFDQTIFWASLLPDNEDALMKMHRTIADIIKQPVKANYDPHMTLINTKDPSYENLVNKLSNIYIPIQDIFVLALGKSDEIGQLTKVIYSYQLKNYFSYNPQK